MFSRFRYLNKEELSVLNWLNSNKLTKTLANFTNRTDSKNRFISGILGWTWEDIFTDICEKAGKTVIPAPLGARYDLICNGYRIQCKYSNELDRIDIRNKDSTTKRRYNNYDFDLLALKSGTMEDFYLIPIHRLLDSDKLFTKSSIKLIHYADCINNYNLLE